MKNTFNRFLCFVVIFGVFAFCGTFTSCENLFGAKEKTIQEKAYITITTNLSTNARTVLPSEPFSASSPGLTWTLTGSLNGGTEQQQLKEWNDEITEESTTTAYNNMISDTSITLNAGTWTFTLSASNESGKLLEATIEQKINGGENTLVFDMKEAVGEGAASGQIDFTLTFPGSVIKNVNATLTKRGETNSLETQTFTADQTGPAETFLSEVKFSYPVNDNEVLSAGNYILKLELQQQTGTTEATENPSAEPITINTYTCLIHVAPGLCSEGKAELDTLAPLYEVLFEGIDGINFVESIVSLSYNEYTTFALPTIEEGGGYEYQWHKTGYNPATETDIDEPIKDPLKVWINENAHTFVLYRYKIVVEDDIVAKGDSTGDYFSIGTAEGLGIFRDLVNGSHENLKMVDKSGETEEVFVYYKTGLVYN
ncbi:MAG: hypothetical protein E7062_10715, partial [Spirochaetaceae bacterium]|nr:hypothetical protein [Spirochaetaceae bacterium]